MDSSLSISELWWVQKGKEGRVLLLEFTVQQRQQHKHTSNQNTQWAAGRATRLPRSAERKDAELGRNRTGGAVEGAFQGGIPACTNERPHWA